MSIPPVGCYDLDYYNIAHEPKFRVEDAKELVGQKPPFNSAEPRFKKPKKEALASVPEDDEEAK